jgi:hypothetical protein
LLSTVVRDLQESIAPISGQVDRFKDALQCEREKCLQLLHADVNRAQLTTLDAGLCKRITAASRTALNLLDNCETLVCDVRTRRAQLVR